MYRILLALLTGAAFQAASAAPLAAGSPRCRAITEAVQTPMPGIYNVTISTRPDACPAGGIARVRMESGRIYPWRTITPTSPTTFRGVPCWWRATWEAASGKTYTIPTPGLSCPWGRL